MNLPEHSSLKLKYNNTLDVLSEIKVLVAEDDDFSMLYISQMLRRYFGDVITASDGKEALELFYKHEADLVITDNLMPVMTGMDFTRELRKHDYNTPVILLTAFSEGVDFIEALNLRVTQFIEKPFGEQQIFAAVEMAIQDLIINKLTIMHQRKEIELLKYKERYNDIQQSFAQEKQLKIIKNDFQYRNIKFECSNGKSLMIFDADYIPFEILSGDCFSIRELSNGEIFLYIADVMGKGLSSSVTSISTSTYLNYYASQYEDNAKPFLEYILDEYLAYLKSLLLDEEIVSAVFATIDISKGTMRFVNFSMPPIYMKYFDGSIVLSEGTHPPISKFYHKYSVQEIDIYNIANLLMCSDGIIESESNDGSLYLKYIENDFAKSNFIKDFDIRLKSKINNYSDDTTIIFLKRMFCRKIWEKTFKVDSKLDKIRDFFAKFEHRVNKTKIKSDIKVYLSLVMTELIMNAHEHGNLKIDQKYKNQLMREDEYDLRIKELEGIYDKFVYITFNVVRESSGVFLSVSILDEGDGFDYVNYLSHQRDYASYNGLGIKLSTEYLDSITYNKKGNEVTFIKKLSFEEANSNFV